MRDPVRGLEGQDAAVYISKPCTVQHRQHIMCRGHVSFLDIKKGVLKS